MSPQDGWHMSGKRTRTGKGYYIILNRHAAVSPMWNDQLQADGQ